MKLRCVQKRIKNQSAGIFMKLISKFSTSHEEFVIFVDMIKFDSIIISYFTIIWYNFYSRVTLAKLVLN